MRWLKMNTAPESGALVFFWSPLMPVALLGSLVSLTASVLPSLLRETA